MKSWITRGSVVGVCALGMLIGVARASDHKDTTPALANPSLDITDLYAFKDGTNLVLILDVNPLSGPVASEDFRFNTSNGVYTFHVSSNGNPSADLKTYNIQFADKTDKSEWIRVRGTGHGSGAKDEIVGQVNTAADAATPRTVKSSDGKVQIFAGPADDPFFFSLLGNGTTYKGFTSCTAGAMCFLGGCDRSVGGAGCLQAPSAAPYPSDSVDTFAGTNVSSIVIEVPLSDFPTTKLGIWAETNTF